MGRKTSSLLALRQKRWGHVDTFGRSKPNGIRRVFKGKRAHDGRPLPLNLQVRPQRATPTFHSQRTRVSPVPWYGTYLDTLEFLEAGRRVPGLLKATTRVNKKNISYVIKLEYKNKKRGITSARVIYKIKEKDSIVAFGILKALSQFHQRTNLGLYPV